MDRTLIVCVSHHGVSLDTQVCTTELQRHGAKLICATGVADVALARNQALTRALVTLPETKADVMLLVDDDMVWTLTAAAKLVGLARETGDAWSAAYATKDGKLAATPLDWDAKRSDGLRMVGLGFCAIPTTRMMELAQTAGGGVVGPDGAKVIPFCCCGVVTPEHDGVPRWCSEDYWLCRRLGGVRLAPYVSAGHLKRVPLWPDDETMRKLAEGEALDPHGAPPSGDTAASASTKKSPKRKRRKKGSDAAQTGT